MFSINEILKLPNDQLNGKIFAFNQDLKNENHQYLNDKEGEIRKKINFTDIIKKVFKQSNIKIDQQKCFEYFQIKKYSLINDQKSSVICFVNISHKLLLNNKNAEKKLMSLINSTISHEMRNPLN